MEHPASSQSFFNNARSIEVTNSQINAITNSNVTLSNNDPVSTILWPHVAAGAIFNSIARYGAGRCHPGTRRKIIERIVAWIEDPDPTQRILWIYGPAGAGKSAIAQTICELLQEAHPDNQGGSFFFARGTPDRGDALKLFPTLAYQLAIQFPCIRTQLNDVLFRDPSLPTKSMDIQLFYLITQPLKQCQTLLSHSPVIVIDGLDECADEEGLDTQRKIVALIAKSVVDHKIPLRFMVASRPEYWIRDAFDTVPLPDITLPLSLQDDIDASEDIKRYLVDGFEQIRVENKRVMGSVVSPWPSAKIVSHFVYDASGQYIYAATLLRFVGKFSKFSNPQKQLDILISLGPQCALAFSELDRLYATILSTYPQWETMKRVLAALLLEANKTIIRVVLGVDSDELVLVLDALSSLVNIKKWQPRSEDQMFFEAVFDSDSFQDGSDIISFYHLSFREFLQDKTRSGPFHIDLRSDAVPQDIVKAFFGTIYRNLEQNYEIEPHVFRNIDHAIYHRTMSLVTSRSLKFCVIGFLLPFLTRLTAKLELFDPGRLTNLHSVFHLIRVIDHAQSALYPLLDSELVERFSDTEEPKVFTEFRSTSQTLGQAIETAKEGLASSLASCTDFEATPSFVYLMEFSQFESLPSFEGLLSIAGINDAVSALKQYHYTCQIRYESGMQSWIPDGTFPLWTDSGRRPDWRNHRAWRDILILFASRALKSILGDPWATLNTHSQLSMLSDFFDSDSREISDIANEESFHTTSNLDILSLMSDVEAWTDLLNDFELMNNLQWQPFSFLLSILSWINRHLMNPQTVTLLGNHDKAIQQRMVTVMNCVLEGLLEQLAKLDGPQLCAYASRWQTDDDNRSTAIKVWSLPRGFRKEEMVFDLAHDHWPSHIIYWLLIHYRLFEETMDPGNTDVPIDSIIHPSQWHPHFLTKLLKNLVRFLYGQIHPEYSTEKYDYEPSFPYITECLPYAHPTQINLDALRALVYLYPQVVPPWEPPEGLWSSLVDFLHKYDRSILSAEELRLFVVWLNSTKHEDIKTYIDD